MWPKEQHIKSLHTFCVVPRGGGWILLHQRSGGFRGAAANLSRWMSIHHRAASSPWRWTSLWRRNPWRWIHLHRGRAGTPTSCLPGDAATSIGGAPGALHFHLGVEMAPSAREPLRQLLLPAALSSPPSILSLPQDLSPLLPLTLRRREGLALLSYKLLRRDKTRSPTDGFQLPAASS